MAYKLTEIVKGLYDEQLAHRGVTALTGGTKQVEAVIVTNGGSGYTSAPTVGFTGGGGSGAAGTAIVQSGVVVAVTITNRGTGYTSTPSVGFSGGGGAGAAGTALMRATALDGFATAGVTDLPMPVRVDVSDQAYMYALKTGTDAESSPLVIRPDDYAASTNEKVWKLESLSVAALRVPGGGTSEPIIVGGGVSASVDGMVIVARTISGGSGNGHAFSDSTIIAGRPGTVAFNSFDARISLTGSGYDYDHYAAFQAYPTWNFTGTLDKYYGLYVTHSRTAGTINAAYGLYMATLAGATARWGVYISDSAALNYFAGCLGVGTDAPTHSLTVASSGSGLAIYNTADQVTNYERLRIGFGSNVGLIRTEQGGTGVARPLEVAHYAGAAYSRITMNRISNAGMMLFEHDATGAYLEAFKFVGASTASSNAYSLFVLNPTVNQSGTAGYRLIRMDVTET